MNYTAVIFNNTGFNNSNIPDSDTFVYTNFTPILTTTPLNILQNIGLSSISVKSKYENIKNADYCYIYKTDQRDREHTFFYFIDNIDMVNSDTVMLTLTPDFLTSVGGPSELSFLDGVTERHHVSEDTFGKYTEPDVLLNCTEPLRLVLCKDMQQTNLDVTTLVDTTLDLPVLGNKLTTGVVENDDALTFTNNTTGASCTVPHVNVLGEDTIVNHNIKETLPDGTQIVESYIGTRGFATFKVNTLVLNGMGIARDLGIEQAILNQYQIPNKYIDYTIQTTPSTHEGEYNHLITVSGKVLKEELPDISDNNFIYNENIKNKRCLYGSNNAYTLVSCSGNKSSYNPENLIVGLGTTVYPRPVIVTKPDCRADGAPYFNFQYIDGSNLFIKNAVKGAPWRTIPLVFQQKSGNLLDRTLFNYGSVQNQLSNTFDNTRLQWQQTDSLVSMYSGVLGNAMPLTNSTFVSSSSNNHQFKRSTSVTPGATYSKEGNSYLYENTAPSGTTGILTAGLSAMQAERNYVGNQQYLNRMYQSTEEQRLYQLYSSIYTVAPEINFSYNNEYIRDFYGNSYLVYRYKPSENDLNRQDLLLTMYGYRHTDILKSEYFTNRQNFNYVSANNITIENKIPNWMKTGIAAQLAGGVRIWHVIPDVKYYNDNPIKTN